MAYGFQETDTEDKKDAFWDYLDEEITEATNAEAGLIIHYVYVYVRTRAENIRSQDLV